MASDAMAEFERRTSSLIGDTVWEGSTDTRCPCSLGRRGRFSWLATGDDPSSSAREREFASEDHLEQASMLTLVFIVGVSPSSLQPPPWWQILEIRSGVSADASFKNFRLRLSTATLRRHRQLSCVGPQSAQFMVC
jgi:hypothetical protein